MFDTLLHPTLKLELLFTFAIALAVSSLGFTRLVYFVSLGYALSMTGGSALALARDRAVLDLPVTFQLALLCAYGVRLSSYLVLREREPAYRRELQEIQQRATGVTFVTKVLIWLGVSLLYVLMLSPAQFNLQHLRSGQHSPLQVWAGVAVMALGLTLEWIADRQKATFKRGNPTRFCDVKLYRFVRCPNYLGELIFWSGNFLAGLHALHDLGAWGAATSGLVCITLIMVGSTKRLERKQDERYGAQPQYQQYIRTVPVLFPFVPVYSLKNVRVYLE